MEREYTLKEFVGICSRYERPDRENPRTSDKAFRMGKAFEELSRADAEQRAPILKHGKDSEFNALFYRRLRERGLSDSYPFLQAGDDPEQRAVAEIRVFEPFVGGVFSQKWHVLISLLALLDTSICDAGFQKALEEKGLSFPFHVPDRIIKITVDPETRSFRINHLRYPSRLMGEWISEAVLSAESGA